MKQIVPGVKTLVQNSDHEQSLQMLQALLQAGVISKPEFDEKRAKVTSLAVIAASQMRRSSRYSIHTRVRRAEAGTRRKRPSGS